MAKKKTLLIVAKNAIDYDGKAIAPEESFDCAANEAERLIKAGAAELYREPVDEVSDKGQEVIENIDGLHEAYPELVEEILSKAREGHVTLDSHQSLVQQLEDQVKAAEGTVEILRLDLEVANKKIAELNPTKK